MNTRRTLAMQDVVKRSPVELDHPKKQVSEYFGANVFGIDAMRARSSLGSVTALRSVPFVRPVTAALHAVAARLAAVAVCAIAGASLCMAAAFAEAPLALGAALRPIAAAAL